MIKRYYIYFLVGLLMFAGCKTTTSVSQIPYRKEYSRFVNDLAILFYPESPQMNVDIRNDEMFISRLAAGPNPIAQLFMKFAQDSANQEDIAALNEIIFDLNICEELCKKLNTKFQLCSYFHVTPQESITNNKTVWKLLEKKDKNPKDYEKIGTALDVDTILEIDILSYGLKDPGIFSDPYAYIKMDVKMTTASEGTVIWRDFIEAKKSIGMNGQEFLDHVFTEPDYLKKHLEAVTDAVSERCIEKLGFDTHYTYLLDEDYIKKSRHKINIADKISELNMLRYEGLISNTDYDKTKLELIEKAKGRNVGGPGTQTKLSVTTISVPEVK